MLKKISYLAITLSILLFTSCSDNSTGPDDLNLSQGQGAFTVTGAVNAEHSGEAWYTVDPRDDGTVFQLFVSDVEFSIDPDANDDVTFVLEFRQESGSGSFSISTGEYNLGANAPFRGMFADVATATAYETTGSSGGTLNITSYSSGSVEAEFEFSATGPEGGSVTVTGGLRASCVGGQFNPNC
jgi:hypothetical protein